MTVLSPRPDLWTLDPGVLHLNHGSYGAVPRRAQEVMSALRTEMDANPMVWFRTVADRLTASRLALASYLETDPAGFALVPNASAGVTVALQTLPIPAGSRIVLTDHAYGAVRYAAERFAKEHGAEVVTVGIPLEADDETASFGGQPQPGQPGQPGQPFPGGQPQPGQPAQPPAGDFSPFWFAVPVPRPLFPEDGSPTPIAELAPGTWYLAVEQRGPSLVAQTQDGRRGVLQDTSGIQRG